MLNMIDIFAGTGAFSLAFGDAVNVVFANDIEKSSEEIYNLNFDHKLTKIDIHNVDPSIITDKVDILTGGFPCQPFSIAGRREGFDDIRSTVFWKLLEIVKHHKPRFVILENVKNILSHDNGKTFKIIIEMIENCGYRVKYKVLDTVEITGIPQHRERVYIVCFKNEKDYDDFSFDFEPVEKMPICDFLIHDKVPDKYYYTSKSSTWGLVSKAVVDYDTIYQYRRVYVRENKNNVCPTLTANMGTGGHNVPLIKDDFGIRKLTPRECFNFQGFPQSYKFGKLSDCKLYKLAGNAVTFPVAKLIADKIMKIVNHE